MGGDNFLQKVHMLTENTPMNDNKKLTMGHVIEYISNLKEFEDDRAEYRIWMEKLLNAYGQAREGDRKKVEILDHAMRYEDNKALTDYEKPKDGEVSLSRRWRKTCLWYWWTSARVMH